MIPLVPLLSSYRLSAHPEQKKNITSLKNFKPKLSGVTLQKLLITLIGILVFNTCNNNPVSTDTLQPGRRDYVWSLDSITPPGFTYFQSIWGSSTKDVWASTFSEDVRDCLWRFDGNSWKRSTNGTPITQYGNGSAIVGRVWGTSGNNVWAFGGRIFSNPDRSEPFVMKFNGNTWNEILDQKANQPDGIFDIFGISENEFWVSEYEYVYHYKNGLWKKYFVGDNLVISSIAVIGSQVYILSYPVGGDSLFLMKFKGNEFSTIDQTTLFTDQKFGTHDLFFTDKKGYTIGDHGIYEANLNGDEIITNTWQQIIKTTGGGFGNSLKLSNKDIWVVGNYTYPYHFNGYDWQPINIFLQGNPTLEHKFWGIWGNGKEIFICDLENGLIYHGK